VTDGVFYHATSCADDFAGGKHHLQTEQVMTRHSILERPRSADIMSDVASDGAFLETGRVGQVEQSLSLSCFVEITCDDTRFDDGEEIDGIDLEDAVHAAHRNDDAAVDRYGAAGITDTSAAGDDRYLFTI